MRSGTNESRSVLDRVADTDRAGQHRGRRGSWRPPASSTPPPPPRCPALLKDAKQDAVLPREPRALEAFAKANANKKAYEEEALERPERRSNPRTGRRPVQLLSSSRPSLNTRP